MEWRDERKSLCSVILRLLLLGVAPRVTAGFHHQYSVTYVWEAAILG